MKHDVVDKIVEAVLYEGYLLYPYRPSVKNRQRWTFGGLFPHAYSEVHGSDPPIMQTECLVLAADRTALRIKVRFLQLISRLVGKLSSPQANLLADEEPAYEIVPSLQVDGRTFCTWQEATERELDLGEISLKALADQLLHERFEFAPQRTWEPLRRDSGEIVGVLVRQKQPLAGSIDVQTAIANGVAKVTVKISNESPLENPEQVSREEAQLQSLASVHTILSVRDGEFVSLMGPPAELREAAAACRNIGTWPVLVGEEGDRDMLLSSPIILYDYPQIAPESPGDLFDATEIDELLSLRIMTLTDEEKHAMASIDERARQMLERTDGLKPEQLMGMHGTMRGLRFVKNGDIMEEWNPLQDRPRLDKVQINGVDLVPGDRVRLRPGGKADILDMALEGRIATIESIEQNYEDEIYLAVTVDDDPGKDLGAQHKIGHRFFFRLEEVEPISSRSGHE